MSEDNGVRVVNFATSKDLAFRIIVFLDDNICKYTWTSPDGKTHSPIHHMLVNRRRHLNCT
jgi:hypothetical protein